MTSIWETIKVEPCVFREGQQPGWVYFLACSETRRCKIGYTGGDVFKRIRSLQTGSAGELMLMAKHPGTPDTERTIHARFEKQRLHGEWFEMSEELFAYLCLTVYNMALMAQKGLIEPEEWILRGLVMIRDEIGLPLPPEMEAMLP